LRRKLFEISAQRWQIFSGSYNQFIPFVQLALLSSFLLYLFWGVAITCGDDYFAATNAARHGGFWAGVKHLATGQSRFYQFFTVPAWQWAVDGEAIPRLFIIRTVCALLNIVAFGYFLSLFLKNAVAASFIASSFLFAVVVDYGFTGFHALPLWFGMPTIFLHFSLGFFLQSLRKNDQRFLWFALLFYATSLLYYESFLLNLPIYLMILVAERPGENAGAIARIKKAFLKERVLWPFFAISLIYGAAYASFQLSHPQGYAGFQLSLTNFGAIIQTVWKFSVSGISLGYSGRWSELLNASWSPAVLFYSLAATLFTLIAILQLQKKRLPKLEIWHIGVLLTLLFAPNLLHAITLRYQEWARIDPRYLGTFFSAFALWVLVVLLLTWSIAAIRRQAPKTVAWAILAIALFLGFNFNIRTKKAFFDDMRKNTIIHRQNQEIVDFVLKEYLALTSITSETLFESDSGTLSSYNYWSLWVKQKYGRSIEVTSNGDVDTREGHARIERLAREKTRAYSIERKANGVSHLDIFVPKSHGAVTPVTVLQASYVCATQKQLSDALLLQDCQGIAP
jgi:hypothetical protein